MQCKCTATWGRCVGDSSLLHSLVGVMDMTVTTVLRDCYLSRYILVRSFTSSVLAALNVKT